MKKNPDQTRESFLIKLMELAVTDSSAASTAQVESGYLGIFEFVLNNIFKDPHERNAALLTSGLQDGTLAADQNSPVVRAVAALKQAGLDVDWDSSIKNILEGKRHPWRVRINGSVRQIEAITLAHEEKIAS